MKNKKKKYCLGAEFRQLILNHTEALCVCYLARDFDVKQIARKMRLTPRTISFYIDSVVLRLAPNGLPTLIERIRKNELLSSIKINGLSKKKTSAADEC